MIQGPTAVLLIEDSEEDFQTVKRLLGKVTDRDLHRCEDAPAAMRYLENAINRAETPSHPWPCVILLDLNMPGEDGRSLLAKLKRDERIRAIPVVILTTSANPKDVEYCYSEGAAGYIVKPVDLGKFRSSLEDLAHYWLRAVTLPPTGAPQ